MSAGPRVLVTAGASRFGALVVTALEAAGGIETIVAVDDRAAGAPFRSAEFVRLGEGLEQLPRIVRGAGIDVVVDVRAAAAIAPLDERAIVGHGTVSAHVAAAVADSEGSVRRIVTVGSVHRYGWGRDLPAFLTEETPTPEDPRGALARGLAEMERIGEARRGRRPGLGRTTVRLADHVGPAGTGVLQAADRLPLLPTVLGFDPPLQVVHEDDAAAAVAHVVAGELDGTYLVAADGTLALSEALRILGRSHAPVLPPWGTGVIAGVLSRAGLGGAHELAGQLRRGRGIDNRRLKATGFSYGATSREALLTAAGVRHRRRVLHPGVPAPYEPEVEAFLRYSPATRGAGSDAPPASAGDGIAALEGDALLVLLPSLDPEALRALRAHEEAGPSRRRVLDEIDLLLRGR